MIEDVGGLLSRGSRILKDAGYIELQSLIDPLTKYVFCIEYPKFFLTAKEYLYKDHIVGVQKELLDRAILKKKNLVIYVYSENKFFIFDPEIILIPDNYQIDIREIDIDKPPWKLQYTMYNWDINLGKELLI